MKCLMLVMLLSCSFLFGQTKDYFTQFELNVKLSNVTIIVYDTSTNLNELIYNLAYTLEVIRYYPKYKLYKNILIKTSLFTNELSFEIGWFTNYISGNNNKKAVLLIEKIRKKDHK